jgi:hypothetical protein
VQGDFTQGFSIRQLSKGTKHDVISMIGKGIKSRLQNTGLGGMLANHKTAQQAGIQSMMRTKPDDGVVCVKFLQNCLVAVVFTSGLLRIWSCESETTISELNLLQTLAENSDASRVSLAKVDFLKQ